MIECVVCHKEISEAAFARRHYSVKRTPDKDKVTCSRKCQVELRKRNNLYKAMSEAGREARSVAVTKSNKEHPRRKKGR